MPTIAELLNNHRDRTGHSYEAMARKSNGELRDSRIHQLTVNKPAIKAFPDTRTIELLSDLLEVPMTTTILALAASLGLQVDQPGSMLSITLPPGTDNLSPEDVAAIRAVTRQLVDARRQPAPTPEPDIHTMQGIRLAEEEKPAHDTERNGTVR
jgi:hypothetical protein